MSDGPAIPQANPGASYVAQRAALDAAISAVLAGGRYILGETVARFEAEFASYLGVRHCVGVGSGTDAVELALAGSGDRSAARPSSLPRTPPSRRWPPSKRSAPARS